MFAVSIVCEYFLFVLNCELAHWKQKQTFLEFFCYTKLIIFGYILGRGNWVVGTQERGNRRIQKVKNACVGLLCTMYHVDSASVGDDKTSPGDLGSVSVVSEQRSRQGWWRRMYHYLHNSHTNCFSCRSENLEQFTRLTRLIFRTVSHNMTMINKTKFLNDTNFIIHMLYKYSYQHCVN